MNAHEQYAFGEDEIEVLDSITFLVPCRAFTIGYCISEERRFGVVDEFLMRLVHIAGSLRFEQIQEYFGFSVLEMQKVLEPLLRERALERDGDVFRIGSAGAECFQGSDDEIPRITVVESREDSFRMDLISYMPAPFENIARMVGEKKIRPKLLWEVDIPPSEEPRSSVEVAKQAFNRSWIQFLEDKGQYGKMKKAGLVLYKTDYASTGDRYMLPVRSVSVIGKTGVTDRQFLPYKTPLEQETREALFRAIAEEIRTSHADVNYDALRALGNISGSKWFDSLMVDGPGFKMFQFIKEFIEQPWVFKEGCTFIFGSSYIERNLSLVLDTVKELNRKHGEKAQSTGTKLEASPLVLTWIRPQLPGWGRSELLFEGVGRIREAARYQGRLAFSCRLAENRAVGSPASRRGPDLHWYGDHFDEVMTFRSGEVPSELEIVLVHDHAVMVIVYSLCMGPGGTVFPVGFFSQDEEVVRRVSEVLERGNLRKLPSRK